MEDSTPISDLPNRAAAAAGAPEHNASSVVQPKMPPPTTGQIDPHYMNRVIVGLQDTNGSTLGTLPTRDIPMNTLSIQQDEQIRANYVPAAPAAARDYVSDYERGREARAAAPQKKTTAAAASSEWDDFLVPFLVGCLFFIFQMPTIQTIFYKYAPAVFHTSDGNLSNWGLLFKAVAFGALYYGIMKFAKTIF